MGPITANDTDTMRTRSPRRRAVAVMISALAVTSAAACSAAQDDAGPQQQPRATEGSSATAPPTVPALSDAERLASAKTAAVGFFQAQATNEFDDALELSSGAAALSVQWARAVNTNRAANSTPYQVPSVGSPNARVQIDSLARVGDVWRAAGFIELSVRPGSVASTTTVTTAGAPGTTIVSGTPSTSVFVTDLAFTEDEGDLRVDDYRLDDVAYPVSQLYMSTGDVRGEAADLVGTLTLARRNLDGTVQYVGSVNNTSSMQVVASTSTFVPASDSPAWTGQTFIDPIDAGSVQPLLVVYPGGFPGAAGRVRLNAVAGVPTGSTSVLDPTGSGTPVGTMLARVTLEWDVRDFPTLVAAPVNTIREAQASSTTSSSSSSSTSSSTSSTSSVTTTMPPTVTTALPSTTVIPTTTSTVATTTSTTTGPPSTPTSV